MKCVQRAHYLRFSLNISAAERLRKNAPLIPVAQEQEAENM